MNSIIIKVSGLYAIYKQLGYIFLIFGLSGMFFFIDDYLNITIKEYLNITIKDYLNTFLVVIFLLVLRIIYGLIYYHNIHIEVFRDRMSVTMGVFTFNKQYLELYRVKDYEVNQNFFMKIFSLMKVRLHTSDKTTPVVEFSGVPKSNVVDTIREWVEAERKRKGVREFD